MKTKTVREILTPKITADMQKKHYNNFATQARFMGNGVYHIPQTNIYSTCTNELFLMFVAAHEGIEY